jgi:hypothetical protein
VVVVNVIIKLINKGEIWLAGKELKSGLHAQYISMIFCGIYLNIAR